MYWPISLADRKHCSAPFKSLKWNTRLRDCFPALGGKFTLCGAFSKLNRQELMLFCVWMQGKRRLVAAFLLMFHIWGKIVHVEIYSNLLIVHKWICRRHVFQTQAYIPVLQSLSLKCIASGPFKLIATLSHCVKGTTFFHTPPILEDLFHWLSLQRKVFALKTQSVYLEP